MNGEFVFTEELAIAQVTLIPLIIAVVGVMKRLLRHPTHWIGKKWLDNPEWELHDDVWFAVSLVDGIIAQVAYYWIFVGPANSAKIWFILVVLGLAFGLASGKAYDEQKARRNGGD